MSLHRQGEGGAEFSTERCERQGQSRGRGQLLTEGGGGELLEMEKGRDHPQIPRTAASPGARWPTQATSQTELCPKESALPGLHTCKGDALLPPAVWAAVSSLNPAPPLAPCPLGFPAKRGPA